MQDRGFVWDSDAEDDEFFDDYVGTSPLIPSAKKYNAKRQKQKQQQGQPADPGRPQVRKATDKPPVQKKTVQYVSSKPRSGPIKRSSVSPQMSSAPPRRYDHLSHSLVHGVSSKIAKVLSLCSKLIGYTLKIPFYVKIF